MKNQIKTTRLSGARTLGGTVQHRKYQPHAEGATVHELRQEFLSCNHPL
jgi:hypothetical protein